MRDIGEILNYLGFGVWQWVGLYIQNLRDEGMKMGLSSWQDLESELKRLLWFEDVHTPMFAELGLGITGPGLNVLGGRA